MKNILVPIDGSKQSAMAIDMAKDIAGAFSSRITLLCVSEVEVNSYPGNPYTFSTDLVNNIRAEKGLIAERILEDGKKLMSNFPGEYSTVKLEGNAAAKIIEYVTDNDVDFVIMGSSGMNGIRGALGSMARRVMLSIHTPTLIVR